MKKAHVVHGLDETTEVVNAHPRREGASRMADDSRNGDTAGTRPGLHKVVEVWPLVALVANNGETFGLSIAELALQPALIRVSACPWLDIIW